MLTEHRADGVPPWIHLDYAGIVQETPYTWATPDLLTSPANGWRAAVPNRGGTTGSLFLLNHWSPPLAPTPAVSAAVNAADVIVGRARTCALVRGKLPNLVAVDWFTAAAWSMRCAGSTRSPAGPDARGRAGGARRPGAQRTILNAPVAGPTRLPRASSAETVSR